MREYNLQCLKFYNQVKTDDSGIITETAPVFQKFIGQPLSNLSTWVSKKFGYCNLKEIKHG